MAGSNLPPSLSRRPQKPPGDEEAGNNLRLGEYANTPTLSVSEANVIIKRIIKSREEPDADGNKGHPLPNTDVFTKTREYLEGFARFRGEQAAQQVESVSSKLVDTGAITSFERAQLGTLCVNRSAKGCCDTVEEARTLIPSLEGKVSDDDLQQVLDDISKLRDFS